MFEFLPYLKEKPYVIKGLILILLIAVSLLLTMVLGIVIALPFFGIGIYYLISQFFLSRGNPVAQFIIYVK